MKRTTLTLLTVFGATAILVGTAQAASPVSINAGLASQTLARSWRQGNRHHQPRHYEARRHHGGYSQHYTYGHHPRRSYLYQAPVYVRPYNQHGGYGYGHSGFYINGRNFSFGIGY